jgi:hypothetical protein
MEEDKRVLAYTLGVDLGQSQDYTAIAMIEQEIGRKGFDWTGFRYQEYENEFSGDEFIYNLVGIKRLPLQMPYPDQVQAVHEILKSIPIAGKGFGRHGGSANLFLGVDRTGVGRPVVDLFRQKGLSPTGVTITGGDQVVQDGQDYRVPKRELVNLVKVLLQQGRLRISSQIPEYKILISEMNNFTYKINDNANDVYGREGKNNHDDMLLALAVALWVGQKMPNHELRRLGPGDAVYDMLMDLENNGWGTY